MPFHQKGNLQYYTHSIFDDLGVEHGYFTRHGGVSPKPWDTLNLGSGQDNPKRVSENRSRVFNTIGRDPASIFDVWQVHSDNVVCTDRSRSDSDNGYQKADGILTNNPEVTLLMRFADCVPILLYEPNLRVAGIAHAGWQGTLKGIVYSTIETMIKVYEVRPSEILAGIGPSIGPDHYMVGEEIAIQVHSIFGSDTSKVLIDQDGSYRFDLWNANRLMLERSGINQIEVSEICTACHNDDWFSHRADHGKTGRFGAYIFINDN